VDGFTLKEHLMKSLTGNITAPPLIILHAGAGATITDPERARKRASENERIAALAYKELKSGMSATDAVALSMLELENSPYSNAGLGGKLQSDGVARLSASLMDGSICKFSAVALVTGLHQPTLLTKELQKHHNSSLGPYGAQLLARELGIKVSSPLTKDAIDNWSSGLDLGDTDLAKGTVGAVALDMKGQLAAATSTGGGGPKDFPGRMSDVSSIAANYASSFAAISCTGVGEQIIRDAIAPRIETRVRDGLDVVSASKILEEETQKMSNRDYGWIAIDHKNNWIISYFTDQMSCSVHHEGLDRPKIFGS
jgi:L-asparaginase